MSHLFQCQSPKRRLQTLSCPKPKDVQFAVLKRRKAAKFNVSEAETIKIILPET